MEINVEERRRNVQSNSSNARQTVRMYSRTHQTPPTSLSRNGRDEPFTYVQQEVGEKLNDSALHRRQTHNIEENMHNMSRERHRQARNMEESPMIYS